MYTNFFECHPKTSQFTKPAPFKSWTRLRGSDTSEKMSSASPLTSRGTGDEPGRGGMEQWWKCKHGTRLQQDLKGRHKVKLCH